MVLLRFGGTYEYRCILPRKQLGRHGIHALYACRCEDRLYELVLELDGRNRLILCEVIDVLLHVASILQLTALVVLLLHRTLHLRLFAGNLGLGKTVLTDPLRLRQKAF